MNWPHRVVVTGLGVISPLGNDAPTYWSRLTAGESGIGQPTLIDPELLQREVVAEVKNYDPADHFEERRLPPLDRVTQFAIIAAREAIDQSGLDISGDKSERTATIIGTGIGGSNTLDESYHRFYGQGARRLHPLTIPKLMPSAPASHVSMFCGLRGPSFGITKRSLTDFGLRPRVAKFQSSESRFSSERTRLPSGFQ